MMSAIIAFLSGGGLSILTEFLGYMDRKNARAHELAIADKGLEKTELETIASVSKEAANKVDYIPTAYPWLNGLLGFISVVSATVRPFLTYWHCVILYTAYKVALYMSIKDTAGTVWLAIQELYTETDAAIMITIISFWFVSRELRKRVK